jgi:hypothetical protein
MISIVEKKKATEFYHNRGFRSSKFIQDTSINDKQKEVLLNKPRNKLPLSKQEFKYVSLIHL